MTQQDLFSPRSPYNGEPPHVRHSETSKAAARDVRPKSGTLRAIVLDFIRNRGERGATDEEMQYLIPMMANTQRPRRCELVERGLIQDSGKKRENASGKEAVVWIAAEWRTA